MSQSPSPTRRKVAAQAPMRRLRPTTARGPSYSIVGSLLFHGLILATAFPERIAKARPELLVLHPGPMNRGLEITTDVADGQQSAILQQVTNGLAVRMAVLYLCVGANSVSRGRA